MKNSALLFILTLFATPIFANVSVPSFISDGMVLQRNAPINIWGWAEAGEKISITFNKRSYQTTATGKGEWAIALAPQREGGPFEMKITGNNELVIRDILIGEVWIASGQSNMEYEMRNVRSSKGRLRISFLS